ncbi:acyltransferase [Algibacter sp. AS12]|uniref:acyltransferase family protein n=1 Tax=Algibacter sp. AS12 TaxID=3135773 RepID=UPI00398B7854
MRITKLDGLRGIFSVMIVIYHYYEKFIPALIHDNFIVRSSYSFVDFFFVLSGFVISYNYDLHLTYKEFWIFIKKRFARLFPLLLYSVTIVFLIKIATIFIEPKYEPDTIQVVILRFFNSILFLNSTEISGVFNLSAYEGLNIPSWSISSEMISYIVFGIISTCVIGKKKSVVLFSIIVLSALYVINKEYFFLKGDNGFIRGLISFNLGYFVYKISKVNFKLNKHVELIIPILLIVVLYYLHNFRGIEKQMFGLKAIPLSYALFILILLKTNSIISWFLDTKFLQFLGKISYSVYLNHSICITLIPTIIFEIIGVKQNTITETLVFISLLIFVIFYSNLTYKYIEIKGGKLLRKYLLKQ